MRRVTALPVGDEDARPRPDSDVGRGRRGGEESRLAPLDILSLVALATAFVALNAVGSSTRLIAAGAIFGVVFVASLVILGRFAGPGGLPSSYPVAALGLSLLAFHFSWGFGGDFEWRLHVADDEPVAYALVLAAAALLAAAIGSAFAGAAPEHRALSAPVATSARAQAAVAVLFVVVGLASRLGALRGGYAGFAVEAFGLGQRASTEPLAPTVFAFYSLLGVGETALLVLLLADLRADTPRLGRGVRLVIGAVILVSFGLDVVLRLQSASRATMLAGLIPPLVTAHAFGYRKALLVASVVGVVGYVLVVYPLANALRYDTYLGQTLAEGGLFVPDLAYVGDAISDAGGSLPGDAAARLNQTSLLAFAVERQSQGLAPLSGQSYADAVATIVPRVLVPDRADRQIAYDFHTGYAVVFRGYNNWGIHTEAYLNFGVLGVVAVMATLGYVWQRVYRRLCAFAYPFGWAICASVLLPAILRAGEYPFLAAVVSPAKTLLLALVCAWCALAVARRALPDTPRRPSRSAIRP